jgi:hypothetical protein
LEAIAKILYPVGFASSQAYVRLLRDR